MIKLIRYIVEKKVANMKVFASISKENKRYLKELGNFIFNKDARNWVFNFTTDDLEIQDKFQNININDLNINNLSYYELPELNPFYVEIPETMLFVFPQDKFIVEEFIVELTVNNNKRYVNTAYLEWESFKNKLDAPQNASLKRALEGVWDFVRLQTNTILPYLQDPQNNTLSPYILIIQ